MYWPRAKGGASKRERCGARKWPGCCGSCERCAAAALVAINCCCAWAPPRRRREAGGAARFVAIQVPPEGQPVTRQSFHFRKPKLQKAEAQDGHYLLRSNLVGENPAVLWERYVQLTH